VIMFAMIVCTLMMITMLRVHRGGARNAANHFTQAEMDNIAQLSREAQAMKEHDTFLRNDEPSLERMGDHRRECNIFRNGDCSCQRGAYSIAEVRDLENQLLQTENAVEKARGTMSIRNIKFETSIGLDNFRRVFPSPTASSSLDDAMSVGTTAPGESRGTGNQLFGANGKLSSTFAYWGRVLNGALGLIPRLYALIQVLWQRLSTETERADAAEARADSAEALADSAEARREAAGAAHLKQIERVAKMHSADVAQLAQERHQWAQRCGQLEREKRALHEALTAELDSMRAAMEQERNNHRNAQEALEVRGVCGLQEANARHTANETKMAAEMRNIQSAYDASMGLLKVVQAAGKMEARAREEAVRANARIIEEASAKAFAQRTAFVEELVRNQTASAARYEEAVASMSEVTKRWTVGVRVQSRMRSGAVVRHPESSNALKTTDMLLNRALRQRVQSFRRRLKSDPYMDDACKMIGRIHCPGVLRPPATEPQKRARYDARALLAAMKSTGKAAVLHALNNRIARAQQYRCVYDKVMRAVAEAKRIKRRSTLSKLKAAVLINGITGGYKALLGFRRLERDNGGSTAANCSLKEINEGTGIIWEACQADLTIYATRDGHAVSLRNTVEVEMLRILQTAKSKAPRKTADGKERAKPIPEIEPRTAAAKKEEAGANPAEGVEGGPPTDCLPGPDPYPDKWQDRFSIKFTWDSRSISKKMHQTEGMLLIIPRGSDGMLYCQSALRIRTIIVYTGKDSKEMVQRNMKRILDEIEDLRVHGLRYSAEKDTFLNQVGQSGEKAPLKSGDRDVGLDMFLPADMAAHIGLFGHGGTRDSDKHFCTHCTCSMSKRHTPNCLVRVGKNSSVRELADEHGMSTALFLALNTGKDPTCMFPEDELTERVLSFTTRPLSRGRNPAAVADPQVPVSGAEPATAPAPARPDAPMQHDCAFGGRGGGPAKKKRKAPPRTCPAPLPAPLPQAAVVEESLEGSGKRERGEIDLDAAIGPDETKLRGDQAASADTLVAAGTIIRVVSTFKVDRPSQFMAGILNLDQHRFCFCSLHAHMRLTEALVKPMFARAIASNRVPALNAAFRQHLGLENTFAEVQSDQGSGKVWKPISFKAFECHLFTLGAVEKVLQQVWPEHDEPISEPKPGGRGKPRKGKPRVSSKNGACREWGGIGANQQKEYKRQYLCLWKVFLTVMDQMRCRDPERVDLVDFGKNCRDLGARWCMLMPKTRCGSLYLHTIMMHGGAFMEHLLPLNLTIGMLENSGAERRHQIGKVHFRKSLGGGGTRYSGMTAHENRSAYLTIRGVLIWQYGRDLVALEEMRLSEAPTPAKKSCRGRGQCGASNQLDKISSHWHQKPIDPYDEVLPDVAMQAALDTHGFDRLDADVGGPEPDVYEAYVAQDPDCAEALDEDGGLQIKAGEQLGEYLMQVDGHQCLSEGSDQSGSDNDSESPSSSSDNSLSEGNESGSEQMSDGE